MKTISAEKLDKLRKEEGVLLVDVRTPMEFARVHAEGAINIPLGELTVDRVRAHQESNKAPVYLICQSGARTRKAAALLGNKVDSVIVEGGTKAWRKQGLPIVGGRQSVSLGTIGIGATLVCILLGAFVSQKFFLAAAIIWVGMILTGNAPCCAGANASCAIPRNETNTAGNETKE